MSTILAEIKDNIGIITLNRPDALNAINMQMVDELEEQLNKWKDVGLYAVIVTGAGRSFAAGADISQMSSYQASQAATFAKRGQQSLRALERFPAPTIAAVNIYLFLLNDLYYHYMMFIIIKLREKKI